MAVALAEYRGGEAAASFAEQRSAGVFELDDRKSLPTLRRECFIKIFTDKPQL